MPPKGTVLPLHHRAIKGNSCNLEKARKQILFRIFFKTQHKLDMSLFFCKITLMPSDRNFNRESDQKTSQPHDLFFKKVMNNPLAVEEFIQAHIPSAIAKKIDPGSLTLVDGSFICGDLQERRSDIIYKATFQGAPGYIYCLIEHQSRPDRLMPVRILEYVLQLMRRELEEKGTDAPLPLVYPCVIYHGKKPYCYTTDIFEMFQDSDLAREIFLKPFHLVDLTSIPDEDLKKRPLLGIMEMLLKYAHARDTLAFIRSIADLLQKVESMNQLDIIEAGAYYLFATTKDGTSRYEIVRELKNHLNPSTQDHVMTIAEAFIEEGRQEGLLKGLQKGRQEGEAALLLRQLQRRFGSEAVEKHVYFIHEADSETLAQWGENFVDAKTLEEVFGR